MYALLSIFGFTVACSWARSAVMDNTDAIREPTEVVPEAGDSKEDDSKEESDAEVDEGKE